VLASPGSYRSLSYISVIFPWFFLARRAVLEVKDWFTYPGQESISEAIIIRLKTLQTWFLQELESRLYIPVGILMSGFVCIFIDPNPHSRLAMVGQLLLIVGGFLSLIGVGRKYRKDFDVPSAIPMRVSYFILHHRPVGLQSSNAPLHRFKVARGHGVYARLIPLEGMFKSTGVSVWVNPLRDYSEPVIYIDSNFAGNASVKNRALSQVAAWERLRAQYGLTPEQWRARLISHPAQTESFARSIENNSPPISLQKTVLPARASPETKIQKSDHGSPEDQNIFEMNQPLSAEAAALFRSDIKSEAISELRKALAWAEARSPEYHLDVLGHKMKGRVMYRIHVSAWIEYYEDVAYLYTYTLTYVNILRSHARYLSLNLAQQAAVIRSVLKDRDPEGMAQKKAPSALDASS
jgi:hypothetical protein